MFVPVRSTALPLRGLVMGLPSASTGGAALSVNGVTCNRVITLPLMSPVRDTTTRSSLAVMFCTLTASPIATSRLFALISPCTVRVPFTALLPASSVTRLPLPATSPATLMLPLANSVMLPPAVTPPDSPVSAAPLTVTDLASAKLPLAPLANRLASPPTLMLPARSRPPAVSVRPAVEVAVPRVMSPPLLMLAVLPRSRLVICRSPPKANAAAAAA